MFFIVTARRLLPGCGVPAVWETLPLIQREGTRSVTRRCERATWHRRECARRGAVSRRAASTSPLLPSLPTFSAAMRFLRPFAAFLLTPASRRSAPAPLASSSSSSSSDGRGASPEPPCRRRRLWRRPSADGLRRARRGGRRRSRRLRRPRQPARRRQGELRTTQHRTGELWPQRNCGVLNLIGRTRWGEISSWCSPS